MMLFVFSVTGSTSKKATGSWCEFTFIFSLQWQTNYFVDNDVGLIWSSKKLKAQNRTSVFFYHTLLPFAFHFIFITKHALFYLRLSTENNFISHCLSSGSVSPRLLNNWRHFLCFLSLYQRLPSLVQQMSHNKLIWAKHFGSTRGILIALRV